MLTVRAVLCAAEAVVRLLHLNAPQNALKHTGDDDLYKVLVLDSFTKAVIAPLLRVNELRKHGITMHLLLETDREKIPDTPCIYFVRASEEAVRRILVDASAGLYDSLHLNFTPHLPKPLMEQLATGEHTYIGFTAITRACLHSRPHHCMRLPRELLNAHARIIIHERGAYMYCHKARIDSSRMQSCSVVLQ